MTIHNMTNDMRAHRHFGFAIGLMTGTFVGAGLMMWLVPKAMSLRERMSASAKSLGERTSAQYHEASTSVGAAVGELARKGQDLSDDIAASVARGAHEVARAANVVERLAAAVTSDRR